MRTVTKKIDTENDSSKALIFIFSLLFFLCLAFLNEAHAAATTTSIDTNDIRKNTTNNISKNIPQNITKNILDEWDPKDPQVQEKLEQLDQDYFEATGQPAFLGWELFSPTDGCRRMDCPLWVYVRKSTQRMYVYQNNQLVETWKISSGASGYETPDFDRHPNGRIYDEYSSTKYPGGDYRGLGNMPYAVFIEGGYAIHGTVESNWKYLGRRASHGCIRLHPSHAYQLNRWVRQLGISQVWITVVD